MFNSILAFWVIIRITSVEWCLSFFCFVFSASVLTNIANYQMVASPELNYAAPTSDSGGDGTGTGDSPATETPSGSAGGATPMTPATTTTAAHRPDEPFVPGKSYTKVITVTSHERCHDVSNHRQPNNSSVSQRFPLAGNNVHQLISYNN